MKIISLINQKGGVGKTTIATNIVAALANKNKKIAAIDLDEQQSFFNWINSRPDSFANILHAKIKGGKVVGYENDTALHLDYLILDTPSTLNEYSLKKIVLMSDKIIVPIKPGFFDIVSTNKFLQELVKGVEATKREIGVGLIGNAIDVRSKATQQLIKFIDTTGLDNPINIKNNQAYVDLTAYGLTIFDEKTSLFKAEVDMWASLIEWLEN